MSIELNGVRSSCDMFAKNSDLYCDEEASSAAFSASSAFECCNSACCLCSSSDRSWSCVANRWDSLSRASVRALAMMVLIATPMVLTNWSKKARCTSENRENEASSMMPSPKLILIVDGHVIEPGQWHAEHGIEPLD